MNILLINLDQSDDRLKQQIEQFKQLNLNFQRLSAVSTKEISKQDYQKLAFSGQRPLKESELACFLSHKKAWEVVIQKNEPYLILEDDVLLVKDLEEILKKIKTLHDIDHISLEVHGRKKIVSKSPYVYLKYTNYCLFELYQDRSGAAGYILFPSGAQKLINLFNATHPKLADEFISHCYSLKSYQIEPAAVIQRDKAELYCLNIQNDSYTSMIGDIVNQYEIKQSYFEKIYHKKKRIKTEIFLAFKYIYSLKHFKKRYIRLDVSKFINNSME